MTSTVTSNSDESIYIGLAAFLKDRYTGVKFHRADLGVTTPASQYGTVDIISSVERGITSRHHTLKAGSLLDEEIRGWFEKTVSFTIHKDSDTYKAVDIAEEIVLHLRTSAVQNDLSILGIGFVRHSSVRSFSVEVKSRREQRAQVDVVFNVYKTINSDIENIEQVELHGGIIDEDGNEKLVNNTII